ncbi:hypothetical protein [Pseudomonas aeruginosa]|nr:hypothetical protein [Pseudomonas aeruginosa]
MLINKQSLNAAFVAIKTIFNNAFAAAPPPGRRSPWKCRATPAATITSG